MLARVTVTSDWRLDSRAIYSAANSLITLSTLSRILLFKGTSHALELIARCYGVGAFDHRPEFISDLDALTRQLARLEAHDDSLSKAPFSPTYSHRGAFLESAALDFAS